MIRFRGGPADGHTLQLRRTPLFLRVVASPDGHIDALDLFDDEPTAEEVVHVYRREGLANPCHVSYSDARGRRRGRWCLSATYVLASEQPPTDAARSTEAWRRWCLFQVAKLTGKEDSNA